MELENDILKLTCKLYSNLKFSRTDITFIIDTFQDFIKNIYNPLLLRTLQDRLHNAISQEAADVIPKIFQIYSDPFKNYDSDKKRLRIYKNRGLYVEPEVCNINEASIAIMSGGNKVYFKSSITSMIHCPLRTSLTKIFQMNGLFEATIARMNKLKSQEGIRTNFIQGTLWKNQIKNFTKTDGIALPLFAFFDDIEPGNALGSHAGQNETGATYVTSPCFPENFSSKLESIIVSDIFLSRDRKTYGTDLIFKRLINDLEDLQENGIYITTLDKKVYKIYFITSLVLGDNKGMNSIFGFVESFTLTHCCRVCYAGAEEIKALCKEDTSLLRTKEKYESDVKHIDSSKTGIKWGTIFNRLIGFHLIDNISIDIMHDLFEGVANYVMAMIILRLLETNGRFSLEILNFILQRTNFAFESSNVPLPISLEYLKKNKWLKMSASEMLFFTRYFGLMVGDLVSNDCEVWQLYIQLREIVHILTSPMITELDLLRVEGLITEHHTLYKKLFGDLKFKFHILLHYVRIMRRNGPAIHTSSIRYESKHREITAILNATASRVNVLQTIGIRQQLSLMHFQFSKYEHLYVTYGSEVEDDEVRTDFPSAESRKTVKSVTINDVTYKPGTIILAKSFEHGPGFGKIHKVYVIGSHIIFKIIPFKLIGFNTHFFANSVIECTEKKDFINYNSLPLRTPCLLYEIDGMSYIATRHTI